VLEDTKAKHIVQIKPIKCEPGMRRWEASYSGHIFCFVNHSLDSGLNRRMDEFACKWQTSYEKVWKTMHWEFMCMKFARFNVFNMDRKDEKEENHEETVSCNGIGTVHGARFRFGWLPK
jgi:hypothetical protein